MSDSTRQRTLPSRTRRWASGLIDLCIVAGAVGALALIGAIDFGRWMVASPGLPRLESIAVQLNETRAQTLAEWFLLWTPLVVYELGFGAVERDSVGRWVCRLTLVGKSGHPVSKFRRSARALALFSWPATGLLAPLVSWVSPSQRSLADYLSGVWVVNDPAREHAKAKATIE